VSKVAQLFVLDNFPEQAKSRLALNFSEDLQIDFPGWSLGDVLFFFRLIGTRDGFKIYGNFLSPLRLREMATAYDTLKEQARHAAHLDRKAVLAVGDGYREPDRQAPLARLGGSLEQNLARLRKNIKKAENGGTGTHEQPDRGMPPVRTEPGQG